MSFTGNVLRDNAIIAVIQELQSINDPLTLANVGLVCEQKFGSTFNDLLQSELDAALALLSKPAEVVAADEADEAEQPAQPAMSRDEAQDRVRVAANNVLSARLALQTAEGTRKLARGKVADAVMTWSRGGLPPLTQDELKRETLRSNQLERERNANGRTSITARRFVQKQMQTGNARGSVSLNQLQHMRARHRRELAAAAKLPSER